MVLKPWRRTIAMRGFSLVELLIVLLVVSILAALLLPAMERSIDSARDIACKNNLRQFAVSEGLYSQDFRGPAFAGNGYVMLDMQAGGPRLYYNLMAGLGYTDAPYGSAITPNGWSIAPKGMWACPSATIGVSTVLGNAWVYDSKALPDFEAEYPSAPNGPIYSTGTWISNYMPNPATSAEYPFGWNVVNYGMSGAHLCRRHYMTAEMRQYAKVMLMSDAASWEHCSTFWNSTSPQNYLLRRHDEHWNAALWDGHVASIRYGDFRPGNTDARLRTDGYPFLKAPHALINPNRSLRHIQPSEYP